LNGKICWCKHQICFDERRKQHRFIRESGDWYIDLAEYPEQGRSKGVPDLDTMLNMIVGEETEERFK